MSEPVLYFDRNIGRKLPDALRTLDLNVEHHCFHFKHDAADDKWLAVVGRKGWFVVTHDSKFHEIEAESFAVKQYSLGCFYLWGGCAKKWDKMKCFVRAYDKMIKAAIETPRPFIFRVDRFGRLSKVKI